PPRSPLVPYPTLFRSNATKAAVLSVSESLMGELREIGTQVSVVMPTFFQSNLLDSFRGPAETRNKASELIRTSRYTAEAIARDLDRKSTRLNSSHVKI